VEETVRKYGWKRDLPDHRDLVFLPSAEELPKRIDLRPYCSKVEDQGNLGSCTANALVGALELIEMKKWKKYADLSRRFVYYNELDMEGSLPNDSGARIRDGVKTLAQKGVCLESIWPYIIDDFAERPSVEAYTEALLHKIISYRRVRQDQSDMLAALAEGFPFVFGFSVFESFESAEVAKSGIVSLPKKSESFLGGHAVCSVGYDMTDKDFICRNSWGQAWGDHGYFYMPFAYLTDPGLASDFWTIHTANV
jgi:C1A family cysteine protease